MNDASFVPGSWAPSLCSSDEYYRPNYSTFDFSETETKFLEKNPFENWDFIEEPLHDHFALVPDHFDWPWLANDH